VGGILDLATRERADRLRALFDALLAEHERITIVLREEIQRQLPTYRELPGDLLDPGIDQALTGTLRASASGRYPASEALLGEFVDLAELANVGRTQAELGIPLFEMLSTWRIGVETIIVEAGRHTERLGMTAEELLEAVRTFIGWIHATTMTTAGAHQMLELEKISHDHERRADFVRGVLLGTLTPAEIRIEAQAYGIDPTREYLAIRARPIGGDSSAALQRALGLRGISHEGHGLGTVIEGDVAAFVRAAPSAPLPGTVGVGPARLLERLSESFRLATRAMVTAANAGLDGVHKFDDLGVRPAISADSEVGEALHRRYIEPLGGSPSASELLTTLAAYFDCSMRSEPAAKRLFIHPNTLRYRLGTYEKMTGADLRDPKVAFEVWWAVERAAMLLRGDE
jgi:PucR C-terminal helix-turn-helix domain